MGRTLLRIGVTACFTGLRTRGGAASVGNATTRTVVASIFLIIVVDSIFATVSTYLQTPGRFKAIVRRGRGYGTSELAPVGLSQASPRSIAS